MRGLGSQLAVVAVLLIACGSKQPCGPCNGCCDSNGACQVGSSVAACGEKGASCATCLPGETCQSGACVASAADGGGCGPANCAGCCGGGGCQPGSADSACGVNGAACSACAPGAHCGSRGTCDSAPCSGCKDVDGSCAPGNTNLRCGSAGASCQVCAAGTSCIAGACRALGLDGGSDAGSHPDGGGASDSGTRDAGITTDAGGGCGPGNCAGCCSGNTCVPVASQSVSQCGSNGMACASCGGALSCQSGACLACTGDHCRQSDGSCVPAGNMTCGGNGSACVDCTQQAFATMCGWSSKSCTTAGFAPLGSSCTGDDACFPGTNLGAPYCRSLWPEGFCEDLCDTQGTQIGSCAFNAFCLPTAPLDGGDYEGVCMRSCTAPSDCTHDAGVYICDRLGGGIVGYCAPACAVAAQCQSWFGDSRASCNTGTQQCCGVKSLSCCPGTGCLDGSTCSFGYCS